MTKPVPFLILSDAPSAGTGLGRIAGDLAKRIHANMSGVFRVGTVGNGGNGSKQFDFPQYHVSGVEKDWTVYALPEIWEDFAGDEKGIVLAIWDLSRLGWFAQPSVQCPDPALRAFLENAPFKKWTYTPIDAEGPNSKLTFPLSLTLLGFDRVLAYGKWGAGVVDRTLGIGDHDTPDTDYLPHGIDTAIFHPNRARAACRTFFTDTTGALTLTGAKPSIVQSNEVLVGIVATNQSRKDWALGIETAAILAKNSRVRLWIHTDMLERHWSIPALLIDYGLADKALISMGKLSDEAMATAYTACDVVLGIAPEGFGYVHVESTACGTPCIVGTYAGGAELVSEDMHVFPTAFRYDGVYSCKRPVFVAKHWASMAEQWIKRRVTMSPQYDWSSLWMFWEDWLLRGIEA